jgi:S1-C subfamily serine protease
MRSVLSLRQHIHRQSVYVLAQTAFARISRCTLGLTALAALVAGSLVGCAPDFDDTRLAPIDAVVAIHATGCFAGSRGTGAIVDGGLVLTSAHVVSGTDRIEVTDNAGTMRLGTIVHSDPDLDIALIEVDGLPWLGVIVSESKMPRGQLASALLPDTESPVAGNSDAVIPHLEVRPVVLETEDIFIEDTISRPGYEVRSEIVAGDSGAPLIVDREIVGIIWARSRVSDDRAWAINVSSVRTQIADPSTRVLTEADRCP